MTREENKLNKYVWLGLQSFPQSAVNPGSPQGSPQHQGDEVDEELDVYLGLLFKGSVGLGEEKADEVRI